MSERNQILPTFFIYVPKSLNGHATGIHFLILFENGEGRSTFYFPW